MSKARKAHEAKPTEPILSLLSEKQRTKYVFEFMKFCNNLFIRRGKLSLVDYHKRQLGRQDFCFTTFRRYWVWETDKWRVYVNNEMGVNIEVPAGSTVKQALDAFKDYRDYLFHELS